MHLSTPPGAEGYINGHVHSLEMYLITPGNPMIARTTTKNWPTLHGIGSNEPPRRLGHPKNLGMPCVLPWYSLVLNSPNPNLFQLEYLPACLMACHRFGTCTYLSTAYEKLLNPPCWLLGGGNMGFPYRCPSACPHPSTYPRAGHFPGSAQSL